jgi:hypothetical protein
MICACKYLYFLHTIKLSEPVTIIVSQLTVGEPEDGKNHVNICFHGLPVLLSQETT